MTRYTNQGENYLQIWSLTPIFGDSSKHIFLRMLQGSHVPNVVMIGA